MKLLLILFLMPVIAHGGSFAVVWSDPQHRENGTAFAPGEFWGTRVTYYRKNSPVHIRDVQGQSIIVSGLKNGWWTIYLQALSYCYRAERDGSSYQLSDDLCESESTSPIRVRVK